MDANQQLIQFALKHAHRLRENIAIALDTGEVEAVHLLRIASRRLNEPLQIMAAGLPAKNIARIQQSLRGLRRAFRDVRDLDVLMLSLSRPGSSVELDAHDLAGLEGLLTTRRQRAFEKARRNARRLGAEAAADPVERACADCEKRPSPDAPHAQHQRTVKMWQRRARALFDHSPLSHEARDLHATRIALKKLRYCTELLYALEDRSKDALLTAFRSMQDCLGTWNDHIFAAATIARIAARPKVLARQADWSASVLQYAALRAQSVEQERRRVLATWPAFEATLEAVVKGRAATNALDTLDMESMSRADTASVSRADAIRDPQDGGGAVPL